MLSSPSLVQTLILFSLLAVGLAAGRLGYLDEATSRGLSKFLVNFVLPALIIASMQRPYTVELRDEALKTLALSFAFYALSFPLALLLVRLEGARGQEAGAQAFGAIFTNSIFMGFPIIAAFFGPASLFAAAIFNIPFQLLAFSVGAWMLARGGTRKVVLGLSSLVTPAAVAAALGFALFLGGLRLPSILSTAASLLGDMTTPLSMVLIGAMLSRMGLRELAGNPRLYVTAVYRLVLLPALLYGLLWLLGFRGLLLGLPVVVAAMPVAANAAILAEAYDGDSRTASSLVFLTTLGSLVTIPILGILVGGMK
jgi:predicted permease